MPPPPSRPRAGEAEWPEQAKTYTWNDEAEPTYLEVRVYYSTQTMLVTRVTAENTSTLHDGIVTVTGRNDERLLREAIPAPSPLRSWDLGTNRFTIRGSDNTDKFAVNLSARG